MYNDLHRDGPRDDDDGDMVTPTVFSGMILEWTDPRRNVVLSKSEDGDLSGQAKIAIELLTIATGKCKGMSSTSYRSLDSNQHSPDKERKLITTLLPKIYIDPKTPLPQLTELYELISDAIEGGGVATDAAGRNALAKLEVSVGKLLADAENEGEDGNGVGGGKADLEDETVMPTETEAERTEAEKTDGEGLESEMEVDGE